MYAIVDIETTGGHAAQGGITEVAIILHNGQEEEGRYQTLVNPGMPIPPYVQSLTGITDKTVAKAPAFEEVAGKIFHLLSGRIFVAHNVNFDYSFLRHNLLKSGYDLDEQKLCTVRLSRKIFPGYESYSLGKICRNLGIPIEERHRAMGDAHATSKLFTLSLLKDRQGVIKSMLKKGSREGYLPLNLPAAEIDKLPKAAGVYYFHDQRQKIIYVGKARDLKKRVTSHFSNNSVSKKKQELMRNIHSIGFTLTGTEFTASILESIEIRKHWPIYNKSQKQLEFGYGIFSYVDQQSRLRLGIDRLRKNSNPIIRFPLLVDAHQALWRVVRQHHLCPVMCFLQKANVCEGECGGVCSASHDQAYNLRVKEAINQLQSERPNLAIKQRGPNEGEVTWLLMEDGQFYGMGNLSDNQEVIDKQQLKEQLTPYHHNEFIRTQLLQFADAHPLQTIFFQ
ncbi:MAG: exonuclease domain-containing protein [Chitinophagaceae bacterium]